MIFKMSQVLFCFYDILAGPIAPIVSPIKETLPLTDKEIEELFAKFPNVGKTKSILFVL